MSSEKFYIEKCCELIEKELGWGESNSWQNQDFEQLGEKIFQKTNGSLSVSTLKRIWGKVKYNSSPNLATLNTLAQFIGYENWRAFTSNGFQTEIQLGVEIKKDKSFKKAFWILGISLLLISLFAFLGYNKVSKQLIFHDIVFTSKPVTKGVPNTVIFKYDVTNSNADSIFIQQSWNPKLRQKVDADQHESTTTYYTPGYYKAKLVLNDSIAKEHDLFIESGGWLGMIENKQIPTYFSKAEITQPYGIGISIKELKGKGVALDKELPWVSFYNVDKDKTVPATDFTMEAEIRNTCKTGQGVCQKSYISLLCSEGFISIPLCIKGCVGEMNLYLNMQQIDGKTHDLSAFGTDFNDFVTIKCTIRNKEISISINEKLAYQSDFTQNMGKVVGTQIRFMGTGEIRKFELK
ncbi:MAG: hypothetical protein ABIQ31_14460 [Ferruginibacter sp.]